MGRKKRQLEELFNSIRLMHLLLPEPEPEPEPEPVDAELLPGEGVPGSGSGDWSGIAEAAEPAN